MTTDIDANADSTKKLKLSETKYYNSSHGTLEKLNQVSPSFCLAKWYNVSIHIPTGQTHSCYHPKSHHIPLKEIKIDVSALHNTKYKKEQRKKMLEGERPEECEFCWQIEDSGTQLSDRAYRSNDVYEEGIIQEALDVGFTGNANPRYVEVNFNQACNFKCSYCSPHLSTEWMNDIEQNGAYILKDRWHNDLTWMRNQNMWPNNSPDNPYLTAFWKWFPTIYPTLNTFRMTGGEPLMDKNTFKIFEYVKSNPKKDLLLSITSNCCPPKNQWAKFIENVNEITHAESVDKFLLYCSLDSWGEQAAYIRNGMDFDKLYKNISEFLSNPKSRRLIFIITFNALSYFGFFEYMKNIMDLRKKYTNIVWMDMPQLQYPEWLNPKLLPHLTVELEKTRDYMQENIRTETLIHGFLDEEVSKVQRLIDWINSPTEFDREMAMKNFYMFYVEYDRRNDTNFLDYFPELETFWYECKDLVENE